MLDDYIKNVYEKMNIALDNGDFKMASKLHTLHSIATNDVEIFKAKAATV